MATHRNDNETSPPQVCAHRACRFLDRLVRRGDWLPSSCCRRSDQPRYADGFGILDHTSEISDFDNDCAVFVFWNGVGLCGGMV
jgi:hypothetical protein